MSDQIPKITPEPHEEARRLYCETDMSVRTIAAVLGLCPARIYRMRQRRGWPLRRPDLSATLSVRRRAAGAEAMPLAGRLRAEAAAAQAASVRTAERPPGRNVAPARGKPPAHAGLAAHAGWRALARRLARIAAADMARLEAPGGDDGLGPEGRARTVASLARSLKELRQMLRAADTPPAVPARARDQGQDHGPEPRPRSINELRDELYRRLLRIRAEQRLARRDRQADRA